MKRALLLSAALLASVFFLRSAEAGALSPCKGKWKAGEYSYDFKEPYADFQKRLQRSGCEKEWTVLVYMAADNDLHPYALWDLYEMEARFESERNMAGSSLKTDLLVQVDGPAQNDLRRLHIFSGPVAYGKKTKSDFENGHLDQVKSPVVERPREDKKSEKDRLAEFLAWGAKNYPAKNYMVIVWGHGQGWKSYPVKNPARSRTLERNDVALENFPSPEPDAKFGGIAFRQNSGTWLDIPALRSVLDGFKRLTGKAIDVYASDACLMQMLEVSYELSSSARFVVGSTQVQNFLGLPYRRILYELNTGRFNGQRAANRPSNDGKDEAYLMAKMIPQLMKASLDPRSGSQGRADRDAQKFVTSSSLTSAEFQRMLIPEITKLGAALKAYLAEDNMRTMDLQFVLQNAPAFEGSAQDFGIFLGMLELQLREEKIRTGETQAAEKLKLQIARTKDALNRSVLAFVYGSSYGVDEAKMVSFIPRAVSMWLPVAAEEYKSRRSEFTASRLYKETRWNEWLDLAYAQ
jgi:hypothetical protein